MSATGLIIHYVYDFKMFVIGHLTCHLDSSLKELPDSNVPHVYSEGFLMLLHGTVGTPLSVPPLVKPGIVSKWEEAKAVPTVLAVSFDSSVVG